MKINDFGIILYAKKFGDSALLVKLFSENNGIMAGLVKGQKKHSSIVQKGNLVEFNWSARLEDHLGNFNLVDERPYALLNFSNYSKIMSISSVTSLIESLLPEKENYPEIYEGLVSYLENLDSKNWIENYVNLEMLILDKTGFGIDTSICAVSGAEEDIFYISPKTGAAVCKEVGDEYADRLFKIPSFFLENPQSLGQKEHSEVNEILEGLEITRYFLAKHFFSENLSKLPPSCFQFSKEIERIYKKI